MVLLATGSLAKAGGPTAWPGLENLRAEFGVDERSVWPVVERIFNLIKAKFPEHEITPLSGGGTNALYLLERNGIRTVLKIAMISNFNAGVEEECLHILNRSRFAPRLYERFEIDRRTSLRIEYIEGPSYLSLILERLKDADVGKIFPLFSSLGELLAELHAVQLSSDHRLPCFNIHPPEKNTFIEESLYQRSVQRIMGISGDTDHAPVLVHGDFGYHNVIFDLSGQSRVIDWERLSSNRT